MNDELKDKYPLCVASGCPTPNEFEEQRLNDTLSINEKVELKLKAGITPTVKEEMFCTLPYDLPGEKWDPLTEYNDRFLISNRRRIKRSDGRLMTIKNKGIFETHFNNEYVYINVSLCAFEHFDESDIRKDKIFEKYHNHQIKNNIVIEKLKNNESLTSEDITFCTLSITLPKEEWKPIKSYNDKYEVSNIGRVRDAITKKIINLSYESFGYAQIHLWFNSSRITTKVHRLVAEAFIPKTEEDIRLGRNEVNHKDGDKIDNRVENLEWCTNQENLLHYLKILKPLR